jgi:serine/threonine-protein kinase RsbW
MARKIMNPEILLTMRNNLVGVSCLIEEANRYLDSFPLPPRVIYLVNLALEEILTNIVKYAFEDRDEHTVQVALRVKDSEVRIECSDDGRLFDPVAAPAPQLKDSISECREGGLGIHLVRQMVDSMEYRRDSSRNVLTMKIRIDRS